jgi:hypothetical protein
MFTDEIHISAWLGNLQDLNSIWNRETEKQRVIEKSRNPFLSHVLFAKKLIPLKLGKLNVL